MFIPGYANAENVFYCLNKKSAICRSASRAFSFVSFLTWVFLSYNVSLSEKKQLTQHVSEIFQVSADEGMGINKVNVWSFQLKNVCDCVISARKAKHLDATTMFTYSHANTPLGQSERAYYLSYFIKTNMSANKISLPQGQSFTDRKYFLNRPLKKIFSLGKALALRKANFVSHILAHNKSARCCSASVACSFVSFYTHQLTSDYSISLIRDPARETCQYYLRVAWISAFKQFFLNSCCLTNEKIYCL